MRSFSANNSLQTCRWRICRFELSSTLTGADSGKARRGASVTENNVTWLLQRRASARTKCHRGHRCFGEHLTPGCPCGSCLIAHLHSESLFFLSAVLPSLPPSLAPLSPLPSAWSQLPNSWGLVEVVYPRRSRRGARERGGSNGDRLQTRSCRLSSEEGYLSM